MVHILRNPRKFCMLATGCMAVGLDISPITLAKQSCNKTDECQGLYTI